MVRDNWKLQKWSKTLLQPPKLVLFHDIVLEEKYVIIPVQLRTNIQEKIHAGHES